MEQIKNEEIAQTYKAPREKFVDPNKIPTVMR